MANTDLVPKHHYVMIRYSILTKKSKSAWKIGKKGFDEYKKSLFDKERLSLHEYLFETVTLPSLLKSKKDHPVTVMIFTSESLPEENDLFLRNLSDKYEWLKVIPLSDSVPIIPAMEDCLRMEIAREHSDVIYSTVRIDDDDAVAESFFDKLSLEMTQGNIGKGVSFSTGYGGIFDINKRKYVSFHEMKAINIAIGLALISRYNKESSDVVSIYGAGPHSRLHLCCPVIVSGGCHMYLRTVHAAGDFFSSEYKDKITSGDLVSGKNVVEDLGISFDFS